MTVHVVHVGRLVKDDWNLLTNSDHLKFYMRKKINRQLLANDLQRCSNSCIRMTHIDSSGFHKKGCSFHTYWPKILPYHSECVALSQFMCGLIIVYVWPHIVYLWPYYSVCVHTLVFWQARLKQMDRAGPVAYHSCKQMQFKAQLFQRKI